MEVKPRPSQWASQDDLEQAERRWPRSVPNAIHVAQIAQEVGLSIATAKVILAICWDGADGDCVELAE